MFGARQCSPSLKEEIFGLADPGMSPRSRFETPASVGAAVIMIAGLTFVMAAAIEELATIAHTINAE